jgi:hypothetical protein
VFFIFFAKEFHSSVAQWQSMRLLTAGLLVRVQPGEQEKDCESGIHNPFFICSKKKDAFIFRRSVMPEMVKIFVLKYPGPDSNRQGVTTSGV